MSDEKVVEVPAVPRVSVPSALRKEASRTGDGIATVHVAYPNGRVYAVQAVVPPAACRFLEWAAAAAAVPELREKVDLEGIMSSVVYQ